MNITFLILNKHFLLIMLSIPVLLLACSQDWTGNFQVIVSFEPSRNFNNKAKTAQSAEAVEYTDCTFAEGYDPPPMSVLDMTLNSLMVRFQ